MNYLKLYLFLLILVLPVAIFCQAKKIKTINSNVLQLKDSSETKSFYRVTAYFTDNGLHPVHVGTFMGSDLKKMMVMIDSASKGREVILNDLMFIDKNGKQKIIRAIPYNFNRNKDSVQKVK